MRLACLRTTKGALTNSIDRVVGLTIAIVVFRRHAVSWGGTNSSYALPKLPVHTRLSPELAIPYLCIAAASGVSIDAPAALVQDAITIRIVTGSATRIARGRKYSTDALPENTFDAYA